MKSLTQHPIIILDFGSQYTQLIGRRIRDIGVYCEIYPYHVDSYQLQQRNPAGFILSGGPSTVTHETNPRAPEWVFQSGLPILGICYGMQTMAAQLGGQVESSPLREFGYAKLRVSKNANLLGNETDELDVWMSHGDKVTALPNGFEVMGSTTNASIAAMADVSKNWYGLQFHPEVTHTPEGMTILRRFVLDICQADAEWTPKHIIDEAIANIKQQVGSDKVLLALSGGVDSSVVAAMLHQAIGDQLVCVFVDTGLLRLNEASQVQTMFGQHLGVHLITVNAKNRFYKALESITCPEEKRKIIGHTFIEVFEEEAKKLVNVKWLAQGTIYPDVIESAAVNSHGTAEVIKSHHNVAGLPLTMQLKLLEPLRELFKDEVRQVGLNLGLPHEMVFRHPFPGPGLGVRILGEIKQSYADTLRLADAIFIDELRKANLYDEVSQAFAVFLPVKSVGVMGDGRRYDHVICLRAVQTIDFMTAHWAHLPWDFLANVSNRIINEVKGVSRVTYDISGKPPATIEWE
jgi:GMP synthase (glutamine-hydrolysing)